MNDIETRIAHAICQSRKFETGEGTCAAICLDQLGDARKPRCRHEVKVHSALAGAIIKAIEPPEPPEPRAPTESERTDYFLGIDRENPDVPTD